MPFSSASSSLKILKNKNYRTYFTGQLVSMSGTWMQSVAQSWLVYKLSNSGYWLGVITLATQLPAFLASPLAGVTADHVDRRRILLIVQVMDMAQAFIMAALVWSGKVQLAHVVMLSVVLGVVGAFDMTTRHAFAVDMVGKGELAAAIALNSVLINIARVFGPILAGALLAAFGEAWCFFLNGLSYVPVLWGLYSMNIRVSTRKKTQASVLENVTEGVKYVRHSPIILRLLVLSTFVCMFACPFMTLLPMFAKTVLGGEADTLAWLTGGLGFGAVMAALLFHGVSETELLKRRLIADVIFWGVGLVALGLSKNFWLSMCAMFTIGYFMMSVFPLMNNAIQQLVDDSMRGRVMSLYTMTFLGTMPLASLAAGWLADHLSAPVVVLLTGGVTVLMGFSLAIRSAFHRRSRIAAASDAKVSARPTF